MELHAKDLAMAHVQLLQVKHPGTNSLTPCRRLMAHVTVKGGEDVIWEGKSSPLHLRNSLSLFSAASLICP